MDFTTKTDESNTRVSETTMLFFDFSSISQWAKRSAYLRDYNRRPYVRAKNKARDKTPARIAYFETRKTLPEAIEKIKARRRSCYAREYNRRISSSFYRKIYCQNWYQMVKEIPAIKQQRRAYQRNWVRTSKGQACAKRGETSRKLWRQTPRGKASNQVLYNRRRAIIAEGDLTLDQWLKIQYRSPICPMCGRFVECENLTQDHIIPLSIGGKHTASNIQALCMPCNVKKGARYFPVIHDTSVNEKFGGGKNA